MPKDKTDVHARLIDAARQEFLANGLEKASIRAIAARVGMTSAGLYRHFADKEAMFGALVEPTLEELKTLYADMSDKNYALLDKNRLDELWGSEGDILYLLRFVYGHFDAFKLILCCSSGTRYASFIHDFVMLDQEDTLTYMAEAEKRGVPVRAVDPEELHLLLSAYADALFEVVLHDFPLEKAEHYYRTLQRFFYPGWREILGL